MKQRKIPMRMCLGCHNMISKKELVRLVKGKEGGVSIDKTGRKAGRGAYMCKNIECFERIRKGRKIDKAFECHVDDEIYTELQKQLQQADQGV